MKRRSDGKNERISLYIIVVLLVLQIIFSFSSAYNRSMDIHFSSAFNMLSAQISADEGRRTNLTVFAATLASEPSIIEITNADVGYIKLSDACKKLRQYLSLVQGADNVYLYCPSINTVYDAYANKYAIGTEKIASVSNAANDYLQQGKWFRVEPDEVQGVVLGAAYYTFGFDMKEGVVVVVKEKYKNLILGYTEFQSSTGDNLMVTTQDGKVIYGSNFFNCGMDASQMNFFKKRNSDGYYTEKMGDANLVVRSRYSKAMNRWYFSAAPKSRFATEGIRSSEYIYTYLCILITAIVLLRLWHIWKRLKMLSMNRRIKEGQKSDNPKKLDLSTAIWRAIAFGYGDTYTLLQGQFKSADKLFSVRIKIDGGTENYTFSELELVKYGIDNIFTELMTDCGSQVYKINDISNEIDYICTYYEIGRSEMADKCIKSVYDYAQLGISIVFGMPVALTDIRKSFLSMVEMEKYSFLKGKSVMIDYLLRNEEDHGRLLQINNRCNEIKGLLQQKKEIDISDIKCEMLKLPPDDAKTALRYLVFSLYSAAEYIEKNSRYSFASDIASGFTLVESAEHIDEVFDFLYKTLLEFLQQTGSEDGDNTFVRSCNTIIENNYADEGLCCDTIADMLGFSSAYLARKYRKIVGMSIADAINSIRLEKAALLLTTTNDPVRDIMKKTGFTNNSYFGVLMKKKYGISPAAYRKAHTEKHI